MDKYDTPDNRQSREQYEPDNRQDQVNVTDIEVEQVTDQKLRADSTVEVVENQGLEIDSREEQSFFDIITCNLFKQTNEDKFDELCREIFGLAQIESQQYQSEYFMQNSAQEFMDLLDQLSFDLKQQKKNEFKIMIQEYIDTEKLVSLLATHNDVIQFFKKAYQKQFLTTKQLQEFLEFRQLVIDLFGLIDENNDKTLYQKKQDELRDFWDFLEQAIDMLNERKFEAKTWLEHGKQNIDNAKYHDIQKFLWEGFKKFEVDIQFLRDLFYKKRVYCSSFCCICKKVRQKLTKGRTRPKDAKQQKYGIVNIMSKSKDQVVHLFDLITDVQLASKFYFLSRNDPEILKGQFQHHYNICFTIVTMAIMGPYIIQYSTLMYSFHRKNYFKNEVFSAFTLLKKIYVCSALTFFGVILMPLLDIWQKIFTTIRLLSLFIFCKNKNKKPIGWDIIDWFEYKFEKLTTSNSYELDQYEKQKKYAQVLFEDLLMLILQILIFSNILDVPNLKDYSKSSDVIYQSLVMTIVSIISTGITLYIESKELQESFLEYIMFSMNAKQDYVCYGQALLGSKVHKDIDFGLIELKVPVLTHATGLYLSMDYMFTDYTLLELERIEEFSYLKSCSHQGDHDHDEHQFFEPLLKFGHSLQSISVHIFCTFINRLYMTNSQFVQNHIDLNDIDWQRMIDISRFKKLDLSNPLTFSGKPLLQVCIENENSNDERWQMKNLMEILLKLEEYNPNIYDMKQKQTLLSYCYQNKKHQAFKLMLTHANLDINQINKDDNSTIYGTLFYNTSLQYYHNNGFKPADKLSLLLQKYGSKIDKNKPQIASDQIFLKTPVYYYLKSIIGNSSVNMQQLLKSDEFIQYFGTSSQFIQSPHEIQQLMMLSFTSKRTNKLCDEFLQVYFETHGPFDSEIQIVDKNGNNFMHLTECRFAPIFWVKFISQQNEQFLVQIIRKLLKQNNYAGLTPIQSLLNQQIVNPRVIQRLFHMELIDYENRQTFEGIENDIVFKFVDHFVRQYDDQKTRDTDKVDKQKFFKAFLDELDIYKTMKERFTIINKKEVFNSYFYYQKYEARLQRQVYDMNTINFNQQFQQLTNQKYEVEEISHIQTNNAIEEYSIIGTSLEQMIQENQAQFNNNQRYYILETYLDGLIEMSFVVDFISDCSVLYQLSQSIDTFWFTLTLLTMSGPYFTVYSSLMTFKISDLRAVDKSQKNSRWNIFKTFLIIFPSVLLIMLIFDILSMIINCIIYIIMFFCMLTPYRKKIAEKNEEIQNKILTNILGMQNMEISGFKSQRTILQLQLESIPQIIFQIYLLFRIKQLEENGDNIQISVTAKTIQISLVTAFFHVFLEVFKIYIESVISQTELLRYLVACYSARQSWIPLECKFKIDKQSQIEGIEIEDDNFSSSNPHQLVKQRSLLDHSYFNSMREQLVPIQFENQSTLICNQGYSLLFELSNSRIDLLMTLISNLPRVQNNNKHPILFLGASIKYVSIEKIMQLLIISQSKIDILFDEQVLLKLMKDDERFINNIKQLNIDKNGKETDELYTIQMVSLNYTQVVKVMIKAGARLDVISKNNQPLFEIALQIGDIDMLALVIKYFLEADSGVRQTIQNSIQNKGLIYDEVVNSGQRGTYLKQPLLLLDQNMLIPWDVNNASIFRIKDYVQKYPDQAKQRWNVLMGAYVPELNYHQVTSLVGLIEYIKQWVEEYPPQIKLCQVEDNKIRVLKLSSNFVCQFTIIRRAFLLNKTVNFKQSLNSYIDLNKILKKLSCDLQDILNVYKLYHNQQYQLTIQELVRCDKIVEAMGFDKEWSQYFHNSRIIVQGLQNHIQEISQEDLLFATIDIDDNILAVKELSIYSIEPQNLPINLSIKYEMAHYHGWFETEIPESEFNLDPGQEVPYSDDQNLILRVKHTLTRYDLGKDYRFKIMNLVLKNCIKGGHKITLELLDNLKQPISFSYRLLLYKRIE